MLVGILTLSGALLCIAVMVFLYAAGGGRAWDPTTLLTYCGIFVYFLLSFFSTLPPVRSQAMAGLGVVANLALIPLLLLALSHGGEVMWSLVPFLGLGGLWYLAYRSTRIADSKAQPEQ